MSKHNYRNFIDLSDHSQGDLRSILDHASKTKKASKDDDFKASLNYQPLKGKSLIMIFEQTSTRTRISFDIAMRKLGGETIVVKSDEMMLGKGEEISDTAKVLSRFVDIIMIRTLDHNKIMELADNADIPIINGLTQKSHPCQVMADLQTLEEKKGGLKGLKVTWCGDSNNMLYSWIEAANIFDIQLDIACPKEIFEFDDLISKLRNKGAKINHIANPIDATKESDCIITDTWSSLGDEDCNKHNLLKPYQVNAELIQNAKNDAIFMHCLPAYRGEEVSGEVIDGKQSVVFGEAENRLHIQKSILAYCSGKI